MSVQDNIIRLREITGITQDELARIAGVSRSAVSLWEIGNSEPRMGAVQRIADYFSIPKSCIMEYDGMKGVTKSPSGYLVDPKRKVLELSPNEQELLLAYQHLGADNKMILLRVANALVSTYGGV